MASQMEGILEKHKQGDSGPYKSLCTALSQIHRINESSANSLLSQIESCVSLLDERFHEIVAALEAVEWFIKDERGRLKEEFAKALANTLLTIACEQLHFLGRIAKALFKKFYPAIEAVDEEKKEWRYIHGHEAQRTVYRIAHESFYKLFLANHMCAEQAGKWAQEVYPFEQRPTIGFNDYTINIIHMTSYLPNEPWGREGRGSLWSLIFRKLLLLDAQYTARKKDERPVSEIFQMEEDVERIERDEFQRISVIEKLDGCMEYIFLFLKEWCSQSSDQLAGIENDGESEVFRCLWFAMDEVLIGAKNATILPFAWLYFASFSQNITNSFLDHLWKLIIHPSGGTSNRRSHAAACYMADFLARASFIPKQTIVDWLTVWSEWTKSYLDQIGENGSPEGSLTHGTFYAVCSAIFFVVGFRYEDLIGANWKESPLFNLSLDRLAHCSPNPLRYCAFHVVMIFVNVCRRYQIVWTRELLVRNAKKEICENSSKRAASIPFESFFPFDPYTLPNSSKFITPIYREYRGLSSHSAGTEEGEQLWNRRKRQISESIGAKMDDNDFLKDEDLMMSYGTSPGFQHIQEMMESL